MSPQQLINALDELNDEIEARDREGVDELELAPLIRQWKGLREQLAHQFHDCAIRR